MTSEVEGAAVEEAVSEANSIPEAGCFARITTVYRHCHDAFIAQRKFNVETFNVDFIRILTERQ